MTHEAVNATAVFASSSRPDITQAVLRSTASPPTTASTVDTARVFLSSDTDPHRPDSPDAETAGTLADGGREHAGEGSDLD